MLKKLTLFHIGDIHYPDIKNNTIADKKDEGFDHGVVSKIAPKSLTVILEKLAEEAEKTDNECLFLLSGDITTQGDSENYRYFVNRFHSLLLKNINPEKVHVVPGNHDIQQTAVKNNKQYDHMIETWKGIYDSKSMINHDGIRKETISINKDASLNIFSLNTCVGCGGKREIIGELKCKILDKCKAETTEDLDLYEKLDTPAVDASHLTQLISAINQKSSGKDNLPVILAHHNLLPQRTPRIDIYTELINSGTMREHLLTLNLPLVVCHGHIHDDPIEIISSPSKNGTIIITSAPEIKDGFNRISFFVGRRNYFLGCIVDHYRLYGGVTNIKESYSIPFYKPIDFYSKGDGRISECLEFLAFNKIMRGSECMKLLKEKDISYNKQSIRSIFEEAKWFGLLEINNNKQDDFNDWHIKKVVP